MTTTDETSGTRLRARKLLVPALRGPLAPRVLSVSTLIDFAKNHLGVALPETTASHNLSSLTQVGLLRNPARGLYLNLLADPQPTMLELAPHIRAGAVISLQTVLGQRGVLNNPTPWVTCVVPRTKTSKIAGKLNIDDTTFSFSSMNQAAMCEHLPELTLQPYTAVPTATPEKALLDWIYLAKNSRKWTEPPRFDLDLELLDMKSMDILAEAMGISTEWKAFMIKKDFTSEVKKIPFKRPR